MKRTLTGTEPVTLSEARDHIQGLEGITVDDAIISSLISVAREQAEMFTWRSIRTSTYELRLTNIPASVKLPNPPVIAITSVKYNNEAGTEITMPNTDYRLKDWEEPATLIFDEQPATSGDEGDVTITYTTGYSSDIPLSIKQAILMMVRTLYDNREDMNSRNITELPLTSKTLLTPFRCHEF